MTEKLYNDGTSASVSTSTDIRPCGSYASVPKENLLVKITMGTFIDYFRPVQDLCTMLSSPGRWYWHSFTETGVYTVRNGNHGALLGGWVPYGQDIALGRT